MIFVTLGTQDKSFKRLLDTIALEIEKGNIKEEVIVQAGFTKYQSEKMKIVESLSKDEFEKTMRDASLVITHGGVGSILTALKYNKKVIAVPRLVKYNEHTNDHQKEIVNEFSKKGYILALKDLTKFDKVLEKSKNFKPKKYESNKNHFNKAIADFIDNDDYQSWLNRDMVAILGIIIDFILFFFLKSLKVNLYLNLSISYLFTLLLLMLLGKVKFKNNEKIISSFYLLDVLLMLFLNDVVSFNIIYSKIIINLGILLLYHIIKRK